MRISRILGLGTALLPVVACHMSSDMPMTPPPISPSFDLRLQDIFAGASGPEVPIDLQAPAGDSRLFIAERAGRIRIVKNGTLLTTAFLDISSRVYTGGEAGLLSFAFDPQFATSGFVYIHFIENIPTTFGDIVVERYQVSSDPDVLQTPGAEVIRIPHRDANNHYGGHVFFGPDGMLYLSTGDGGGANNQFRHAQDDASLLGKMLRLDVSSLPYAIPSDNPTWSGLPQTRREIWAIGLRNPFRYAFDGNQLYIADVGQGAREELDVVDAGAAGLNYGWSIMEGTQCFDGPCPPPGITLTAPVYDYDHSQGCAIIGGYVYRGTEMPGLRGTYLFSDLCSGFLRGMTMQNGVATVVQAPNANTGLSVSFGRDGAGELYVLTNDSRVLKVVKP
jgi:glucose/arabinose dehydrogenase